VTFRRRALRLGRAQAHVFACFFQWGREPFLFVKEPGPPTSRLGKKHGSGPVAPLMSSLRSQSRSRRRNEAARTVDQRADERQQAL